MRSLLKLRVHSYQVLTSTCTLSALRHTEFMPYMYYSYIQGRIYDILVGCGVGFATLSSENERKSCEHIGYKDVSRMREICCKSQERGTLISDSRLRNKQWRFASLSQTGPLLTPPQSPSMLLLSLE